MTTTTQRILDLAAAAPARHGEDLLPVLGEANELYQQGLQGPAPGSSGAPRRAGRRGSDVRRQELSSECQANTAKGGDVSLIENLFPGPYRRPGGAEDRQVKRSMNSTTARKAPPTPPTRQANRPGSP